MNETNAKKHYCGMTKQEIYAEKLGTLQDALDLIQGGRQHRLADPLQ